MVLTAAGAELVGVGAGGGVVCRMAVVVGGGGVARTMEVGMENMIVGATVGVADAVVTSDAEGGGEGAGSGGVAALADGGIGAEGGGGCRMAVVGGGVARTMEVDSGGVIVGATVGVADAVVTSDAEGGGEGAG